MSVHFYVERTALTAYSQDVAGLAAMHRRMLDAWLRYGALVENEDEGSLTVTIDKMPVSIRKLWQVAFRSTRQFRRISAQLGDPDYFLRNNEAIQSLYPTINLAVLEETRACLGFLGDGNASEVFEDGHFEICRFDCIDQSSQIRMENEKWNRPVCKGETRDQFWSDRVSFPTRHARHISIVDRYAAKNMLAAWTSGEVCGLARYLRLINSLDSSKTQKKSLTLHVSDYEVDMLRLESVLRGIVDENRTNLIGVSLYIAPDAMFITNAHDRYIRFDSHVITLGTGLGAFADSVCKKNFTCALQVDTSREFEEKFEQPLRSAASHIRIF